MFAHCAQRKFTLSCKFHPSISCIAQCCKSSVLVIVQKVFAVDVWLPGARLTQPCHFNYFLMWLWSNSESAPLFNICCRKAAWGSELRRVECQRATNRKPAVWEMTKEEEKKTYIHKTEDSLKRKTLENDPYDLYNWANYKHSRRRIKISEKKQVLDFMHILFLSFYFY